MEINKVKLVTYHKPNNVLIATHEWWYTLRKIGTNAGVDRICQ